MIKKIQTDKAPKAVGPYSQAIVNNGFVFCSGQIAVDPKTGNLVGENIQEQTEQAMKNLAAVLVAAGSSLEKIVKTTCYLQNMSDYVAFNETYGKYFKKNKPARATIEVGKLPKAALVEIEVIAVLKK